MKYIYAIPIRKNSFFSYSFKLLKLNYVKERQADDSFRWLS